MSATAGMKVRLAAERGEAIPEGWVLDAEGRPTTDPAAYLAGGALAPLLGHKGYGLALLTETLAAALSGAAMTRAVVPWVKDTTTPTGAGHAFVAFDVGCFVDRDEFEVRMQALIDELHAAAPAAPLARRGRDRPARGAHRLPLHRVEHPVPRAARHAGPPPPPPG